MLKDDTGSPPPPFQSVAALIRLFIHQVRPRKYYYQFLGKTIHSLFTLNAFCAIIAWTQAMFLHPGKPHAQGQRQGFPRFRGFPQVTYNSY